MIWAPSEVAVRGTGRRRTGEALVVLSVEACALLDGGQGVAVRGAEGTARELEQLGERPELDADLDAVELEGDEGEGEAGVKGEPEIQGDIEGARLATDRL